jgi:hypothetical protein
MGEVNQAVGAQPGIKFVCDLCSATIRQGQERFVSGQRVCPECAADPKNAAAAAALRPPDAHAPDERAREVQAGVLGMLGALLGGAVWAVIVVLTDYEIGYLAVLVGFLAGLGVKLGAGDSHGIRLQWIAIAATIFGLIATKYFIFAHFFTSAAETEGVSLGYFSGVTLSAFPSMFGEMLSLFDALWVFLAASTAWRIPATPPPPGAEAPPAT